ncbi:MAG: hypothetical protein DRJ38_07335 [Thermoprotei archaeon]|nr:MAG: hypothetical protein DRJ38_07335 [Thermoprotei archaeon]
MRLKEMIELLEKPTKIIKIEIDLTIRSPLHIGLGDKGEPLLRVLRINIPGKGYIPIIPFSTIRGALRRVTEKLAKSSPDTYSKYRNEEYAILVHSTQPDQGVKAPSHPPKEGDSKRLFRELFKANTEELFEDNIRIMLDELGFTNNKITQLIEIIKRGEYENDLVKDAISSALAFFCPICRIYGTLSFAGRLMIGDAIPVDNVVTDFLTRVGIRRDTRTAAEGALFSLEYVVPGTEYRLILVAKNLPTETDEKLLWATLDYVKKYGLQLGASKSTGMGVVEMKDLKTETIDFSADIHEIWNKMGKI